LGATGSAGFGPIVQSVVGAIEASLPGTISARLNCVVAALGTPLESLRRTETQRLFQWEQSSEVHGV